ncbi:MAG: methylenetetrahydrofolate reductase [Nitriliruptorales bacterium]
MRQDAREALASALRRPRYEVIPLAGVADAVHEHVPRDLPLTVTSSPTKGIEATFQLTEQLRAGGFHVVPHLAARLVVDEAHLKDLLERLREAGVREVFTVAGDVEEQAGVFPGSVELLETMAELDHDLSEIGIAGYPESHPFLDDDVTVQAMWDKRRHATYIVSQVCLDADVLAAWVGRVRRRGVALPLHVGVVGAVDRVKLLRIATKVGLGESARYLRHHRGWLRRLLVPGGYRAQRFVEALAPDLADPAQRVVGFHVYTFNELEQTERWRRQILERLADEASSPVHHREGGAR